MAIALVIFDMAGTTVDDYDYVYRSLNKAFKKSKFSITREDAGSVAGMSIPIAIDTLLKNKFKVNADRELLSQKIYTAFAKELKAFYNSHGSIRSKKNAEETFRLLKKKGILVALDTSLPREFADTVIARLQWKRKKLIDYSVASDEVEKGKPHPEMIFKAMKDLKILSTGRVAKVGDTPADLREGIAAGCKYVIGITTGAATREQLAKESRTHLIDDLLKVVDIVTQ